MTKKASDLLTPDEIKSIILACKQSVDRALIMLLYEGGFRIGEIAQMKWEDLTFNNGGVATSVKFKTAFTRHVRAYMCTQYLQNWKADYPGKPGRFGLCLREQPGQTVHSRDHCKTDPADR